MRTFMSSMVLITVLTLAVLGQRGAPAFTSDVPAEIPKPWTAIPAASIDGKFTFTVFGDRTGMAFPGKMETAMALTKSQFIVSVGDNIEGYTRDRDAINRMWGDFDAIVSRSSRPFFRLPGNHDISNDVMRQAYLARYGRAYYAFVYQSVLFLALDTEDPPPHITDQDERQIGQYLTQVADTAKTDLSKAQLMLLERPMCDPEDAHSSMGPELAATSISNDQVAYVQNVLSRNANVKWTFVFMHRPGWRNPPSANFVRIQQALRGRNYTLFAGHFHQFKEELIDGHEYYTTGPTAALPRCNKSQDDFDQILDVGFNGTKPSIERRWVN